MTKKVLVTSALPYINGIKHIGNLVGSMLPADVYSRYMRKRGHDVLFIGGTDEHGTPTEIAAQKAGQDVKQYCDEMYEAQSGIYECFGISWDHFGRTSSEQNRDLTQQFFHALERNGLIIEREMEQIYSVTDQRFLPDRFVEGTCPHCDYGDARGDQCDGCGELLDPTDLIEPRSAISGSTDLEVRTSKHLFLALDATQEEVAKWIGEHEGQWPKLVSSIGQKWVDEGLEPRCITRDLDWGVPVPKAGYEDKVFYVWFDAPIGYIAATKEWADQKPGERDWEAWWKGGDDVYYAQFMAKDNVPFHTVMFPSTVLGTEEGWKLPDQIKGFDWLNYDGQKFSTSRGVGIFTGQALEEFPADHWRFSLMASVPENHDAQFSFDRFATTINTDLANKYGNFVSRVTKLANKNFDGEVPEGGELGAAEYKLADNLSDAIKSYQENLEAMNFTKAVIDLRAIWTIGNQYIDEKAPWNLLKKKDDTASLEEAKMVLRTGLNLVRLFSVLSEPFTPFTHQTVSKHIGLTPDLDQWPNADDMVSEITALKPGHKFTPPQTLFERIKPEQVEALKEKYRGQSAPAPAASAPAAGKKKKATAAFNPK